jgi:beta-glucosidase
MQFPKDFLWGTATAAHQIEGNNTNSDWWHWEKEQFAYNKNKKRPEEDSDTACDSYNRYEEDFELARQMNNNAIRISIEWSRIEPKQGEWDQREIAHYKKVLHVAREKGLKPFVTLQHFTKPLWFAKKGGWLNPFITKYFPRYVKKCAEELGELAEAFITINEPQVYVMQSYLKGVWPPQKKNRVYSFISQMNLMNAHRKAYRAIKSVNKTYKVGIAKNIVWYEAKPSATGRTSLVDRLTARFMNYIGDEFFLLPIKSHLDFIGLNYYFSAWMHNFRENNLNDEMSDMGWWLRPSGIKNVLLDLRKHKLPIYITEHGLADAWDIKRQNYIKESLGYIHEAIQGGANVKGYFHWSLIDNFEWHVGFWPKFGLIEIDRKNNLQRKPRPSYYMYAEICKTGIVNV